MATINRSIQALRIGISEDGINFKMVRNGLGSTDLYRPSGGRDLRDPSIARIGDKWWVCYTVGDYGLNNVPPTSAENGGGSSPVFGVASSEDLITWTHVVDVQAPVYTSGDSIQVWGPEFYISREGRVYITCPCNNFTQAVAAVYVFEPTDASNEVWIKTGQMQVAGIGAHFLEQYIVEDPAGGVWWTYLRVGSPALSGYYKSTTGPFTNYRLYHPDENGPLSGGPNPPVFDSFGMEGVNIIPLGNGHWKWFAGNSTGAGDPGMFTCESFDNLITASPLVPVVGDEATVFGYDHGTIIRVAPKIGNEYQVRNYQDPVILPAVTTRTISGNTLANPSVVTTTTDHGLKTGMYVTISGSNSTPSINGLWRVTVLTATTFSIPVNVTVAGSAGTVTKNAVVLTNVGVDDIIGQWAIAVASTSEGSNESFIGTHSRNYSSQIFNLLSTGAHIYGGEETSPIVVGSLVNHPTSGRDIVLTHAFSIRDKAIRFRRLD